MHDKPLVALAAARLTRLVTTDDISYDILRFPAYEWALEKDLQHESGWRGKLVHGLECPYCVGFWIGATTYAINEVSRGTKAEPLVKFGLSALALNYVVGHVSAYLDG